MKKWSLQSLGFSLLCFAATGLVATQASNLIPFDSEQWDLNPAAKVEEYLGKKALKLGDKKPGAMVSLGIATLKDMDFQNGIIEYDVAFDHTRTFAGVKFHVQSAEDYEKFYMRAHQSGNPDANQYMPIYNGVQSWQLYYGAPYSIAMKYAFNEWMHVKVVVADKMADIYIQDMKKPSLTVALKREEMNGTVGLWGLNIGGPAYFANFSVTPMKEAPALKGMPISEKEAAGTTVMDWSISNAVDQKAFEDKTQLSEVDLADLTFTPLRAEATGLVNLARVQGVEKGKNTAFAKVTIDAKDAITKKLEYGFSDAVKVYLNGQLLASGEDGYGSRDYRFLGTIGFYDAVYLPLKKGKNELLLAISESPMRNGWGVQARFKDMKGITLSQ